MERSMTEDHVGTALDQAKAALVALDYERSGRISTDAAIEMISPLLSAVRDHLDAIVHPYG